jgi:3-oxoadipate enol-lactonase
MDIGSGGTSMTRHRIFSGIVMVGSLVVLPSAALPCQLPGVRSGTIALKDSRIYFETIGSGPAVVFIHGFALNLREWDDQVKALASQYRVISYDRRGFGKSTGVADRSSEPADLKELLDTLGVRSAVLVGHSEGSAVAARFVLAHGDRVDGLVFYPVPPLPGFPIPNNDSIPLPDMGAFVRAHGLDSLFRLMMSLPEFWMPPNRPDIVERIREMTSTYSGRDLLEERPLRGSYVLPTFDQVKRLAVPTMFIAGERERRHLIMVADSMARWMPDARNVVIAGGGHGVHFAEPGRFNDALLSFLGSLPSRSRR